MKLWLRRTHLLLALVSGLFLICLSLTGALLIYAKDIQYLTQSDKWTVTPQASPLAFDPLIARVSNTTKQPVTLLMPEARDDLAWQLQLANNRYVSVNPYTGDILYEYDYYSTVYGFTMALHRWLLYEDGDKNHPLRNWVSLCALILILEILLGFYIWIKPKNRLKRLAIKPKAKFRVLMYQLHTVLGVYLLLPLILIAYTGMAFNWQTETKAVLEFVMQGTVEDRPKPPDLLPPSETTPYQVQKAYNNALTVFPEGKLFRIYLPKKPTDNIGFRIENPGESHAYSWVWANPYTANIVASYDASKSSWTTQTWHFKYKFHIGDFAGPIVQLLWLVFALSPLFFTVSGFYFWYKRHFR
ncbi:PepSY domain-containing protein [Pseudoalteromonas sp. PAB 2.2]|uniref:PepSY-associated TM helix domain-containing protein n=1 Tax=Pseudoalteromonas sp. PAB 2.2 TaxID=1841508 RepID=UPI00094F958A|nr:PepSY-associated TM helix domain-containing protein [Pseudoalteromonas sp. PAB 2.2]